MSRGDYYFPMRGIEEWVSESLCSGKKELFDNKPKEAKKLCRDCPVADECLRYALIYKERGIWGATSDAERHIILMKSPEIRGSLIREAIQTGLYEVRFSIAQYVDSIHAARQFRTRTTPEPVVDPEQLLSEFQGLSEGWNSLLESLPEPSVQTECA